MADAAYERAVKETFETKPLRTVLMIDDEFPTYADLAKGKDASNEKCFVQKDRAVALYEAFQRRQMICDVDNIVTEVHADRIRKSDLIVLDYHLGPAAGDTDRALGILRDISSSKHFNTVVVYTAEPNQDGVWLDVIASLSGGWTSYPARLDGDARQHWERLSDAGTLPTAALDAVMEFGRRGRFRDLSDPVRERAWQELLALGVPVAACKDIINAMLHVEMTKRAGKYASEPHRPAVGGYADGKRWVQSGNAFVTILKKQDLTEDKTDPAGIMARLSEALLAWRPSLVQILISEIQNVLELEALATEDDHLRDPITQTALWYYLLHSLGPVDPTATVDVRVPIISLVDKIVDGVRRRLSSDPDLLKLASDALLGELRDTGWNPNTCPKPGTAALFDAATKVARTDGLVVKENTLYRLNSFFSTEKFRRAHLTTGTVFYHAAKQQYFVAASPACDLVARQPGSSQSWSHAIHPMVPVIAILLHPAKVATALSEAEQATYLFLEGPEGHKPFRILNDAGQPSYEFLFAQNEGRIRERDDGKTVFDAARLTPKTVPPTGDASEATVSPDKRELAFDTFEVVDQLRGMNATRILQMAGQHLSRIGLDFLKVPN